MTPPRGLGFVVLILLTAGCTSPRPADVIPSQTPESPVLGPKQVLQKDNADACPAAFQGGTYPFNVESGYDQIVVEFHLSGAGQFGLRITDTKGGAVLEVPPTTISNPPCTHSHEGDARRASVPPGEYRAVVEGGGVVGYHLNIVEVNASRGGNPHDGHSA